MHSNENKIAILVSIGTIVFLLPVYFGVKKLDFLMAQAKPAMNFYKSNFSPNF